MMCALREAGLLTALSRQAEETEDINAFSYRAATPQGDGEKKMHQASTINLYPSYATLDLPPCAVRLIISLITDH